MPGSPSPVGRKPGICQTGQLVTREGPEGSNPSPGAYFEGISGRFKADESEEQATENLKICVKIELVHVKTRKNRQNPQGILCQFMTVFAFLEIVEFKIHGCLITTTVYRQFAQFLR